MRNWSIVLVASVAVWSSAIWAADAETPSGSPWPQWRGPQRTGQISESVWPVDLSKQHLTEAWSVPLQPSYSGPIVARDRMFVTETVDKKHEVVRALRRSTGEEIWRAEWEGALKVPFFAASNGSWIRSTPAFDGQRLYVAGIRDLLVCLDASSGAILWKVDLVAELESSLPSFGCASSPLLVGDHIYLQAGGGFVKLDKITGKVIWRTLNDGGGMSGSAFSSPVIATIGDTQQLVVQTRTKMAGVEPENGKILWTEEIPAFRGMNILPPTVIGDSVFTSSYGGRSTMLKIVRDDSKWDVKKAWDHKSQGYMSAPVVIDGNIYLHLRNQRLVCLSVVTGDENWTTTPFGKYWSMVANGSRLLALDERGELLLVEATQEKFQLVDRRQVAEDSWAHLAVAGSEIYVRDLSEIKCFNWK